MKSLFDTLNIMYGEEEEERGFLKLNAISLLFTVGGILFVVAALGAHRGCTRRAQVHRAFRGG